MKSKIRGPAKSLKRSKSKRCIVTAGSFSNEMRIRVIVDIGQMASKHIEITIDDATTIDHLYDVARLARLRAKRTE